KSPPPHMPVPDTTIVEFADVSKSFGRSASPALDRVNLTIERGEIFGVIGESGAGKSTLLQLINGLTTPTSGTVTVAGNDVARLGRRGLRMLRRDIGVVFQGIHLLSNRTVRANVALTLQLARGAAASASTRAHENDVVDEML